MNEARRLGIGLSLVLAGCTVADDPVDPEGELEDRFGALCTESSLGWGCRDCGFTNSPYLGHFVLGSFTKGSYSASEPQLIGIEDKNGYLHDVEIKGSAIQANPTGHVIDGSDLVGWTLLFVDPSGTEIRLEITAFELHPDWFSGRKIETYGMAGWDPSTPDSPFQNICPCLEPGETSVVVTDGETYEGSPVMVLPNQPKRATLSCRGHAITKMKFMGYDPNDGFPSTPDKRQATLRMLTADYCGNGRNFTHAGQPLHWIDTLGHFPPPSSGTLEAEWNADGATCLNTPRAFERRVVEAACQNPIPKCPTRSGAPWDWQSLVP